MRTFAIAGLVACLAMLGAVSTGAAQSGTSSVPTAQPPSVPTATDARWREPTTETWRYQPCPSNVVMHNGRHECLGRP
jgi:glucose/arabinose dehydrogenase